MGMMKHYQLALICVGTNQLEQEAIEWALVEGWFKPRHNFDEDKEAIVEQLPGLVNRFREVARENEIIANAPMREFINSIHVSYETHTH